VGAPTLKQSAHLDLRGQPIQNHYEITTKAKNFVPFNGRKRPDLGRLDRLPPTVLAGKEALVKFSNSPWPPTSLGTPPRRNRRMPHLNPPDEWSFLLPE